MRIKAYLFDLVSGKYHALVLYFYVSIIVPIAECPDAQRILTEACGLDMGNRTSHGK